MKGCEGMQKKNNPHSDSQKKQTQTEENRPQGDISVFHNAAEIQAEAARQAELAERERQKKENEANYQAREEYAKELAEERVDLIRLKQGIITEDELHLPQEEKKQYTLREKIGNWFYHSKWWLWGAIFCALVAGFLIFDLVTRQTPDIRILILSENPALNQQAEKMCTWITPVCEDYNNDNKILVDSLYIPVTKESMEESGTVSATYNTQLLIQFQSDLCMLVIPDSRAEPYLSPDEMFVNLEELYPDCAFADGYRLLLDQTDFAEQIELTEPLKEGCYLALRQPNGNDITSKEKMQTAYDHAKSALDGIISILHQRQEVPETNE